MSRTKYNDEWSYEIFDDGYELFSINGTHMIQRDPYGKLFIPDGSYEENALAQLEEMTRPAPPEPPSENEILRADIDYIALMEDLELPSYIDDQEGE